MSNVLCTRYHAAHDPPFARAPSSHHDNPSPAPNQLCPALTNHKLVYQAGIFLCMLQHVWTGTYNGHITLQYIYKLW